MLSPIFQRVFGRKRVLREWFGQLVLYSMTTGSADTEKRARLGRLLRASV
jgi:hypothetical protein